ncbi:bifunctional diguanylate cyclase/phosphodiesterase [Simiduia litorea]
MTKFSSKLLFTFAFLMALTLAAVSWAVLKSTQDTAVRFASSELDVGERVLAKLMLENRRQLIERATLLADDYGFRQAVATNEQETLVTALANHGDRIGAGLVVLIDNEGEVQLSSHDISGEEAELGARIANTQEAFSIMLLAEDQVFQLALVPVRAPNLVAWVGLGFIVDEKLLTGLKDIAKANVSLFAGVHHSVLATTLPSFHIEFVEARLSKNSAETLSEYVALLSAQGWLNRWVSLTDADASDIQFLLSVSSDQLTASFDQLETRMLTIAAIALVLVLAAIFYISMGITKPIAELANSAERMTRGDYSEPITLRSKDEFGVLATSLNGMQTAIKEREEKISYQAGHDLETGLMNRDMIRRQLDIWFNQESEFSVILLSIENIQRLSDLYGVSYIQQFLPEIGQRLTASIDSVDLLARMDSGKFLIAIAGLNKLNGAMHKIQRAFRHSLERAGVQISLDVKMGSIHCVTQANNYEDMIRRINIALAEAREKGLENHHYQEGADERHLRKLTMSNRLQRAIEVGGFELLYQPQLHLATGKITGVEALIRWADEDLGRVFPDEFIPLAEESGNISHITRWVIDKVKDDAKQLDSVTTGLKIGVNLSAKDILSSDFSSTLVDDHNNNPLLHVTFSYEVTETALVEDAELAIENLTRLQAAGISLAMDDFGTGFSSLSQLKMMPIDILKIDKSFVLHLAANQEDQKIVEATIQMAHALGLKVVAEGVEDQAALKLLQSFRCDLVQGYFLARPMTLENLIIWIPNFINIGANTNNKEMH